MTALLGQTRWLAEKPMKDESRGGTHIWATKTYKALYFSTYIVFSKECLKTNTFSANLRQNKISFIFTNVCSTPDSVFPINTRYKKWLTLIRELLLNRI